MCRCRRQTERTLGTGSAGPQRMGNRIQIEKRPAHHQEWSLPAQDQLRRIAAAVQRPQRRNEPRRATAYHSGRSPEIRPVYQGLLHGPPRRHRNVADQRPQRYDLRRTRPDGYLVRPQLERLVRHRPDLAHHRRRTETQRRVLVISLAL